MRGASALITHHVAQPSTVMSDEGRIGSHHSSRRKEHGATGEAHPSLLLALLVGRVPQSKVTTDGEGGATRSDRGPTAPGPAAQRPVSSGVVTERTATVAPAPRSPWDPGPTGAAGVDDTPVMATRPSRTSPLDDVIARALVVVAIMPVVVAAVRALRRGWAPIGDIGLILLRAEDVGTADHPLLGTWTSASLSAGRSINNPGPLWFDVLAPFVRTLGPSVGTAVAVMVANSAAILIAAWAARRAAGTSGLLVVTALSAGLAWSMGSELLFDAWQPNAMVLPFWALLVTLWAFSTGELAAAPWAIGLASLIVQTHLSFVYVVAIIGAAAAAAGAVARRRDHADDGGDERRSWRRPIAVAGIVGALAWLQPALDQFVGQGNLGNLLASSDGGGERVGLRLGTRIVSSVVALPPWWTRLSYSGTIEPTGVVGTGAERDVTEGNIASLPLAIVGLLAVGALLGALAAVAIRRDDRAIATIGLLALVAIVASMIALVLSPINDIGISPHQMRWLWPISALVLAVPLLTAARWLVRPPATQIVAGVAITCLAVATLPTYAAPEGPTANRDAEPTVSALVDQLDDYEPGDAVIFDMTGIRFAEPYSGPVIAALARNGVDVVTDDEGMVGQMGRARRADGTESRRLVLIEGEAALDPPVDADVVAFVDGLDAGERAELDVVTVALLQDLSRTGLRLNADGRAARAAGRFDVSDEVIMPGRVGTGPETRGLLTMLINGGYVELDGSVEATARRYAELSSMAQTSTVGLFERPLR